MKISVAWLKEYVAIPLSVEKLAHRLTLAGLEVEHVETTGNDTVMEMEITPNRPDCLNMIGVAREISAVLNKPLKIPKVNKITFPKSRCRVEIADPDGCRRYIGTVIRGVKVAPSPEWLQRRLLSVGLRPINNIVDITNFVLMETGQPLHAFDYERLNEGQIIVRRAHAGEKLRTLDGIERTLDPSILVIADAKTAVALAGIMGGVHAEVSERTTNILLESAYFNPIVIRRGGRKLGISTDASYRFERGVDMIQTDSASRRAIALILEIAGGTVAATNEVFFNKIKGKGRALSVSLATIKKQLGADISASRVKVILQKLGFTVALKGKVNLAVTAPSFRPDVKRVEDVVEEVARVVGYDILPSSLPNVVVSDIPLCRSRQLKEKIRQLLTGLGFSEIITYTMLPQGMLDKTLQGDLRTARIQNPLSQDQEMMRPTILPHFLSVARLNLNRGQRDLRLFELGKVYAPDGQEQEKLALLLVGQNTADWRMAPRRLFDFYDIKGAAEQLLMKLGFASVESKPLVAKIFDPGEAATLRVGSQEVGVVGKAQKDILRNWDIKNADVLYGEIDLKFLLDQKMLTKEFTAIPVHPAVSRDISLAVKPETSFADIQKVIRSVAGELLAEIRFQELYLGEKIPAGQRGYIFSLLYQSRSSTLTEDEISKTQEAVGRALMERLGVTIR